MPKQDGVKGQTYRWPIPVAPGTVTGRAHGWRPHLKNTSRAVPGMKAKYRGTRAPQARMGDALHLQGAVAGNNAAKGSDFSELCWELKSTCGEQQTLSNRP